VPKFRRLLRIVCSRGFVDLTRTSGGGLWLTGILSGIVTDQLNIKDRFQRRIAALVGAFLLVAGCIAWLTVQLQREASELRTRLRQADSESFRIADQFSEFLGKLNDSLYHYGRSHVLPDVAAFSKATNELNKWIDEQKPKLTSVEEKAAMEQIDHAYDDYMRVAGELVVRLEAIGDASATMDEYTNLRKESQRLSELGRLLSRAHLASKEQFISKVGVATARLRGLVLVSLALLLLLSLTLGLVVYRDMILPLRVRLVESETLLERQEKLASLGVMAAGVANEIRNPLTAIKGMVFLQKKEFPPDSSHYADVKAVEGEILRLERIVDDFLLFARPRDCRLALITADVPLRQVQALLAPELAKAGTQLVLTQAPALQVKADEEQLKQVLINLVRNAAEAIERNGVVKLCARPDHRPNGGRETSVVILEVEDNGRGISAETQKRLFDPFFTTKDSGTGLGLSIAAQIIRSHGGELEYQTARGLGTTFRIVLPDPNNGIAAGAG